MQLLSIVSATYVPTHSFRALLVFLAIVSIGSWSMVLATAFMRSAVRMMYHMRTKKLSRSGQFPPVTQISTWNKPRAEEQT
ncbi:MAG TPA: hypothetical protein VK674_04190 [Candidatus Limnocylindria bacterium]|nr:hypothetical protein [Candidatus Limnocylindria bacterium]